MDKREYLEIAFDEAKNSMRRYYTTLSDNDSNFNEFQLQYDNYIYALVLFVVNNDGTCVELDRWNNFNLTMFKQLISLANQFSKEDNFELWDNIPILLSMRL